MENRKKWNSISKRGGSDAGGAVLSVPQIACGEAASGRMQLPAHCLLSTIEPGNVGGDEAPVCVGVRDSALDGLALRRQADSSSRAFGPVVERLSTPRPSSNAPKTDRSSSVLSRLGESRRTPGHSGYNLSDSESLQISWPSGYNDPDVLSKSSDSTTQCRCLHRIILTLHCCVLTLLGVAWSCTQIARAYDWHS